MNRSSSSSQRGSAILMLFIALALFAALGFAFLQGSRSSTTMITDQQAKTYAQQIIAYGNDVKMAVKRLQLRGCTETQLSFANSTYHIMNTSNLSFPENHNPLSPADGRCDLFKTSGAGLKAETFYPASLEGTIVDAWKAGEPGFAIVQIDGIGTTKPELVLYISKITDQVCRSINNSLGIWTTTDIPIDNYEGWMPYTGIYTDFSQTGYGHTGNNETRLAGKTAFCVASSAVPNRATYHHVLLAR